MGWGSPARYEFGWLSQGNPAILGANSWKTSHGNQHWRWPGAAKNPTWGWFDNIFIFGVAREDFSTVGRELLEVWSADGCFIDAPGKEHWG